MWWIPGPWCFLLKWSEAEVENDLSGFTVRFNWSALVEGSLSVSSSHSVSLSLCMSLSPSACLNLCLSVFLSLNVSLFIVFCLSVCLSQSFWPPHIICLSLCFLSRSLCLLVFLCLSVSPSPWDKHRGRSGPLGISSLTLTLQDICFFFTLL